MLPVEAVCTRNILATGPGDTFFRLRCVSLGGAGGAGSKRETVRAAFDVVTRGKKRAFVWVGTAFASGRWLERQANLTQRGAQLHD